jgi:hypothetical protein
MIVRVALGVMLAMLPAGVGAQSAGAPDRAEELMRLQFNSRSVQPPPGSMDGARATAIYKRFSDPAAHGGSPGGPSPQGVPASTTGPSAP